MTAAGSDVGSTVLYLAGATPAPAILGPHSLDDAAGRGFATAGTRCSSLRPRRPARSSIADSRRVRSRHLARQRGPRAAPRPRSSHRLCEPHDADDLPALRLAGAHYQLGPVLLRDALPALIGPGWDLTVDDGTRRICSQAVGINPDRVQLAPEQFARIARSDLRPLLVRQAQAIQRVGGLAQPHLRVVRSK